MSQIQPSSLLPSLFAQIDEERRLNVLHVGPALPETVEFFSRYRCKLYFVDLFSELSHLQTDAEAPLTLEQQFRALLQLDSGATLDLCLFWDLFNFMDRAATQAFLVAIRPHLHSGTLAHGFAVHNLKTPQSGQLYGIREPDQVSLRARSADLPGYCPHNQGQLEQLLDCFRFRRSVLLPGSRLEMLLQASIRDD